MNQAHQGTNAVITDQGAVAVDNPLITELDQNRLSSELSGLYSYANQIRNTAYRHAAYYPSYAQSIGMLDIPQYYLTPLSILQHNSSSDPLLRIAVQATLENQSQSRRNNILLSDYMNQLTSSNTGTIAMSALGQTSMYPSHGRSTSGLVSTFSDIHRLEQLSQLIEQRTIHNSLATLRSTTTPQLHNFQVNVDRILQNSSLHDSNLQMMGLTNGMQVQTNANVDALDALRRSV